MDRRSFLRTTATVVTGGLGALAGCSSSGGGGGDSGSKSTPKPGQSNTVEMVAGNDYYFDPIGLFVEKGETVTWKIESSAHSSTAYKKGTGPATVTRIPDGAKAWNSGVLSKQGATYEHTFQVEGTYDYFCIPHKQLGMVGRVVVGSPGGPAEGSMPPDGKVPESQKIVDQGAVSYAEFK